MITLKDPPAREGDLPAILMPEAVRKRFGQQHPLDSLVGCLLKPAACLQSNGMLHETSAQKKTCKISM